MLSTFLVTVDTIKSHMNQNIFHIVNCGGGGGGGVLEQIMPSYKCITPTKIGIRHTIIAIPHTFCLRIRTGTIIPYFWFNSLRKCVFANRVATPMLICVMPRSHIHGLDAGLATDTIRHHSRQSVLVRSFPYCIRNHT